MNHLKTHQTSLMAPWDPLNAPLDPLGPSGPPHRPPMTPKQVSCPHWTLQITSPAFQIIRWPIKCHCWSYGTSHPSPSGLSIIKTWDLETLRPWDLETLRPGDHLTDQWFIKKKIAESALFTWSCFLNGPMLSILINDNLKTMKRLTIGDRAILIIEYLPNNLFTPLPLSLCEISPPSI